MNPNSNLAEAYPLSTPQPGGPELRLVQGGGEDPAHEDGAKPDLQVVPEADDPVIDNPDGIADEAEVAIESEVVAEEDDVAADAQERSLRASGVGEYAVAVSEIYHGEDERKHKGGGGWYLRELIRKAIAKLEAKSHASDCDCEFHDGH